MQSTLDSPTGHGPQRYFLCDRIYFFTVNIKVFQKLMLQKFDSLSYIMTCLLFLHNNRMVGLMGHVQANTLITLVNNVSCSNYGQHPDKNTVGFHHKLNKSHVSMSYHLVESSLGITNIGHFANDYLPQPRPTRPTLRRLAEAGRQLSLKIHMIVQQAHIQYNDRPSLQV